jgi:hypothetical protein
MASHTLQQIAQRVGGEAHAASAALSEVATKLDQVVARFRVA